MRTTRVLELATVLAAAAAGRADVVLTLSANNSLSASAMIGPCAAAAQGPGATTAALTGTITIADPTADSFRIFSASMTVGAGGSWQPLPGGGPGAAPAGYGFQCSS